MTRLSSIFSFSTLRTSFWPGGAVVAAVALIAALELGIRFYAPRTSWRSGFPSFDLLVDHYRYRLATTRPDVWLMGNSTLAGGVDVEQLTTASGRAIQALPVGSGTLAGQTAMLDYFLRRSPVPPTQVVVCLTKDDLNARGGRADVSARYLEYDSWRGLTVDRLFRLDDVRTTWLRKLRESLLPKPVSTPQAAPAHFTGQLTAFASNTLDQLARDFTFDSPAFPRLEALSKQYRFRTTICLLPVTDVYLQFHDRRYPQQSFDSIVNRVGALSRNHGFDFYDFSRAAPRQYERYADNRHLNETGRAWFTPLMEEVLDSPSP